MGKLLTRSWVLNNEIFKLFHNFLNRMKHGIAIYLIKLYSQSWITENLVRKIFKIMKHVFFLKKKRGCSPNTYCEYSSKHKETGMFCFWKLILKKEKAGAKICQRKLLLKSIILKRAKTIYALPLRWKKQDVNFLMDSFQCIL